MVAIVWTIAVRERWLLRLLFASSDHKAAQKNLKLNNMNVIITLYKRLYVQPHVLMDGLIFLRQIFVTNILMELIYCLKQKIIAFGTEAK
uniref:Secreted protein n=1 Tax=Acrobeloides nanus TaxID=290746 RepID=A0A914DJB8_9BILA